MSGRLCLNWNIDSYEIVFPSGGIDCSRSCPIWGIDSLCDHGLVEALIYQDHVLVETFIVHKIVS